MKTFWETISENMADRENWRDTLDRMAAEAETEKERKSLAAEREELKKRQIAIVRSKLTEELSRIFQELQSKNIPKQLIVHEMAVLADKMMSGRF